MSLTWRSNNGSTWVLDGSSGVLTCGEDEGIFTIPTDLVIDQRIGDGGVLVAERRSPRRVVLSFLLSDGTGSLVALWRSFFVALAAGGELDYDGPSGIRTLREVSLDGPDRSLTGKDLQFHGDDVYTASLLALDPWWYGATQSVSGTFAAGTAWDAAIAWDADIPWNGGDSVSVTNMGDAATPVLVVVTGQADEVSMSVDGVGGWTTAAAITSGAYLSVNGVPNSAPGIGPHRGPHGQFAGADLPIDWSLLTSGSQLFELPPGESSLIVGATNTDGNSAWRLVWSPRFLSP